ncbi:MAG TPA: LacI family DNA-binding transcriptional regulator [Bacteroidales bacterium]|nr:LacI family DNA-binding transcriptional regulator [Bacteroidales bacterium]HRT89535.1 LacI family DNA-binding transcriptional regulator [Bacteroidales bacterium]
MGKKVKNKDLAERLGVSCTLVSLVLNNKSDQYGIKKETRERVLAMARQMGLFDTGAEKKTDYPVEIQPGIIGMVVPSLHEPHVFELTGYLQKAFESIGVGFTVIMRDTDDSRFNRFVNSFRKFFSGLILYGEAADDKTIRTLKDEEFPFVLLEKTTDKYRVNTVITDRQAGNNLLATHFAGLGYERLLILSAGDTHKQNEKTIREFSLALETITGNRSRPAVEIINEYSSDEGIDFSLLEKYLRPPQSIQAILVMNSALVYPLMKSLGNKKIRIPQDVALISYEDSPGFEFAFPPVTALKRPLAGLSLKAANIIWAEIKNSGKSKYRRQVSIQPSLIVRKSCGTI